MEANRRSGDSGETASGGERLSSPRLASPFLNGLEPSSRNRIFELSHSLTARLEAWAASYPMMRPERALPLSLSVSAAAPFCDLDALEATARVSLFVFALDDFFDESGAPIELLAQAAEQLKRVTLGEVGPKLSQPGLAEPLLEVRNGLAGFPLFDGLQREWEAAVGATIDGMLLESQWRNAFQEDGASGLPSYEDYLACGRYSIGGPPHIWSALITIGDPTTTGHLARMHEMEALSSTCIRLANDLQSHQKELLEGGVNSLIILTQGRTESGEPPSKGAKAAEAAVRREIGRRLEALVRLGDQAVTASGRPEAAIVDIARFVSEFYAEHDFHTFSSTKS